MLIRSRYLRQEYLTVRRQLGQRTRGCTRRHGMGRTPRCFGVRCRSRHADFIWRHSAVAMQPRDFLPPDPSRRDAGSGVTRPYLPPFAAPLRSFHFKPEIEP